MSLNDTNIEAILKILRLRQKFPEKYNFHVTQQINSKIPIGSRSKIVPIISLLKLALLAVIAIGCTEYIEPPTSASTPEISDNSIDPTKVLSPTPGALSPTPSPMPTLTSSPTPKVVLLTVKARRVALRAGPDVNHPLVSGLYLTGAEMMALEKYRDWFYVEAPDGKRGWLFVGWVNINSSLVNEIPSASNIPTPPFFTLTPSPTPDISYP